MRSIDADTLIEDLQYDVELDARALDSLVIVGDRAIIQFDKDCKQNCIDLLRNAPTVDPVKHGRWMHYAHRELQYDISGVKTWGEEYQCSNCGFVHSVIEDFGHYAYCPHCGAYMVDEEEE